MTREPGRRDPAGTPPGRGFGAELGFGRLPAVLVVDLILGFTRADSPLSSDLDAEVAATRLLLDRARAAALPIAFTTTIYGPDLREGGLFVRKVPALGVLRRGSWTVELDPRLGRLPGETLIEKRYASAFFGTALAPELTVLGVDTLVVCGATTSGCVRATVVDALQHGFRPIVPRECVGDRAHAAHEANLADIAAKYGDVLPLATVLERLPGPGAAG